MPKKADPRRAEAREIYQKSNGGVKLRQIADMLGVPEKTLSAWKAKDKAAGNDWDSTPSTGVLPNKRSTPKKIRSTPKPPPPPPPVDEQIAAAVEENGDLTDQQKVFCALYVKTYNATQSYLRAYGCTYETANTNGPALLVQTGIRAEIGRLKEIKTRSLLMDRVDVVELHMRIAFADITDYVEFKSVNRPVLNNGRPVMVEDPNDPKAKPKALAYSTNVVKLRPSGEVDGTLISEVSQGRDGARIKLADRQRSLQFLERYFELNPADQYRREYEARRMELELIKLQASLPEQEGEGDTAESNFAEAMKATVKEVWPDGDQTTEPDDPGAE